MSEHDEVAVTLRDAAQRIREAAQGARPWPWYSARSVPNPSVRTQRGSEIAGMTYADDVATADYMALMHPGVALAIADLFERWAWMLRLDSHLHARVGGDEIEALARLVLGEEER